MLHSESKLDQDSGRMGVPAEIRDAWVSRRKSVRIDSPHEPKSSENKSTVRDAAIAGSKSAIIAGLVASVPVLVGCRTIPWAKANLNYTAQTLLISSACVAGFWISADKVILEKAKENSFSRYDKPS